MPVQMSSACSIKTDVVLVPAIIYTRTTRFQPRYLTPT